MKFKAEVIENVGKNRLLSVTGDQDKDIPQIGYTKEGESPDFRSTGSLKEGQEVTVTVKQDLIWNVEAGEDIEAGQSVEAGKEGTIVKSDGSGFGYITEAVKEGETAQVIRRSSGIQGPRGQRGTKGTDGFGSEKGYKDIIKRLEALEKKEGE